MLGQTTIIREALAEFLADGGTRRAERVAS